MREHSPPESNSRTNPSDHHGTQVQLSSVPHEVVKHITYIDLTRIRPEYSWGGLAISIKDANLFQHHLNSIYRTRLRLSRFFYRATNGIEE